MDAEVAVIGAGVIGLAVARSLAEAGHSVLLFEKENSFGQGTSSRNTETIHAGIYYTSGSLKARLCLRGKELMYEFCEKYDVNFRRTGKIFVAVREEEVPRLESTLRQAEQNGLFDMEMLDEKRLRSLEPHLAGVAGLLSPSSGIVDSHGLMKTLLLLGERAGLVFSPRSPVEGADELSSGWKIHVGGAQQTTFDVSCVINAAGLYANQLSRSVFPDRDVPRLFPVKGSYVRYAGPSPLKHVVYPALIPGTIQERVDACPDLAGSLKFGPSVDPDPENLEDFRVPDDIVERFIPGIKRYLPNIDTSRLHADFAGIRPKIYGPADPVVDYRFDWGNESWLDLWGMESPGLTASLAIGEHVADLVRERGILASG